MVHVTTPRLMASLTVAATLLIASPARADSSAVTLYSGECASVAGPCDPTIHDTQAALTLAPGSAAVLDGLGLSAEPVDPSRWDGGALQMSLYAVTVAFDTSTATADLRKFGTFGGLRFAGSDAAQALTMSGWKLDRLTQSLYANVSYNGSVKTNLRIMSYGSESGAQPLQVFTSTDVAYAADGLAFTTEALDSFRDVFQFGDTQIAALSQLTGGFAVRFSLQSQTPPVPEPSTWALTGLGCVGLGMVARRQRRGT